MNLRKPSAPLQCSLQTGDQNKSTWWWALSITFQRTEYRILPSLAPVPVPAGQSQFTGFQPTNNTTGKLRNGIQACFKNFEFWSFWKTKKRQQLLFVFFLWATRSKHTGALCVNFSRVDNVCWKLIPNKSVIASKMKTFGWSWVEV